MSSLDRTLFGELVDFLIPFMTEEEDRRMWLRRAFDERIYGQVKFTGAANQFTVQLISDLVKYGEVTAGKPAIIVLLDEIHNGLGTDQQQEIEIIRHKLVANLRFGVLKQRLTDQEVFIQTKETLPAGELLPYMIDRDEQEYELGQLLQKLESKPKSPIVCLIYGDEFQCHEMFLERLKFVSLPRLLDLRSRQNTILQHTLHWPTRFQSTSELHDKLRKNLADEICGYSGADVDEINHELGRNLAPVLIDTHLCTEDWQQHGLEAVRSFLHFWRHWPPLKTGQHLVICLCVKYKAQSQGHTTSFFERLRFFQPVYSNLETTVAQTLKTLDFTQFNPLACTILPKLESVKRAEVEAWARRKDTRSVCRNNNLLTEIRVIFEEWEMKTKSKIMPMEMIAPKLEQLLAKYIR